MSQENVERSERAWDRFIAGDTAGVLALIHPDVEVRDPPDMPDARVYRGHAGWQTQRENFDQAFTDISYQRQECIDCGEQTVSVIQATGTATSSGISGEVTYAQVETWRDGMVTSIRYFTSKEAALEAVGLSSS